MILSVGAHTKIRYMFTTIITEEINILAYINFVFPTSDVGSLFKPLVLLIIKDYSSTTNPKAHGQTTK